MLSGIQPPSLPLSISFNMPLTIPCPIPTKPFLVTIPADRISLWPNSCIGPLAANNPATLPFSIIDFSEFAVNTIVFPFT